MTPPIVTFTSDFGREEWFVGVVHGVLHQICPDARVVDLTHAIAPGRIERAAFVLEAAAPDFPAGTIHLAVVDPGVGTARRALAVAAREQFFVGPDNGVLEWALAAEGARAHQLAEPRYFRPEVSRTFHGRDVFAPVAAHLAAGVAITALGPAVRDPVRLERTAPRALDGELLGEVMWIDRFGNALTNIEAATLARVFPGVPEQRLEVRIGRHLVEGLARSYGDSPVGTLLSIIGSSGRLEIAQVGGDLAARLGIGAGDPVRVRVKT